MPVDASYSFSYAICVAVGLILALVWARQARQQKEKYSERQAQSILYEEDRLHAFNPQTTEQGTVDLLITREEVWIRLSFPFSLVLSGTALGLSYRIRREDVSTVREVQQRQSRLLEITFVDGQGCHQTLHLFSRQREALRRMLEAGRPSPKS